MKRQAGVLEKLRFQMFSVYNETPSRRFGKAPFSNVFGLQ